MGAVAVNEAQETMITLRVCGSVINAESFSRLGERWPQVLPQEAWMDNPFQTYMTENDVLMQIRTLQSRGLPFYPMTMDEIILCERMCGRGVLHRDGNRVRLPRLPAE